MTNKVHVPQRFQVADPRTGEATKDTYLLIGHITRKLNEADALSSVTTADATNLATAEALANALKAKLNLLLAAMRK